MILESLITDESKLTLDRAKATLGRGSKVTIEDALYSTPEVQNAIKMGLVKLVGDPPAVASAKADEKTRTFRNEWKSKLTFECLKDYVDPGFSISIPESELSKTEIRNAIAWGMLVDVNAPPPKAREAMPAVEIDEVKVGLAGKSAGEPAPAKTMPRRRAGAPAATAPKAKRIARPDDAETDGDEEDTTTAAMYKESKVIIPDEQPLNKLAPKPKIPAEEASRFDFLDIFGEDTEKDN